jgi:hypothetical protein
MISYYQKYLVRQFMRSSVFRVKDLIKFISKIFCNHYWLCKDGEDCPSWRVNYCIKCGKVKSPNEIK